MGGISPMLPKSWGCHELLCIEDWENMVFKKFRINCMYYISKILGHKRVATTCVYTHVVARTLMKNYYLYHPRAYKRGGEEKIDKMGEEE